MREIKIWQIFALDEPSSQESSTRVQEKVVQLLFLDDDHITWEGSEKRAVPVQRKPPNFPEKQAYKCKNSIMNSQIYHKNQISAPIMFVS